MRLSVLCYDKTVQRLLFSVILSRKASVHSFWFNYHSSIPEPFQAEIYRKEKMLYDDLKQGLRLGKAMDQAIEDCIHLDILREFLLKHRGEVKQMILREYNRERHEQTLREEGRRQEREESVRILQKEREKHLQAVRQMLLQILQLKGMAMGHVAGWIQREDDPDVLQLWASFAADSDSVEILEKKILESRKENDGPKAGQESYPL